MDLPKSFDPHEVERRWYSLWESRGYFAHSADPGKQPYCIQLPPPNVTGTLHMGHAFQQTLMDALIRYHRMRGFNANWVVGTDHAGIATQIVVERQLKPKASRHDLGRDAFVARVWEWKQQSGSTITRQMRRLGASGNWTYADTEGHSSGYFTMDARMSRAVIEVFVRLYEEGLIYRGKRLVNWDPVLGTRYPIWRWTARKKTAVSGDPPAADGGKGVVVANPPETMLGDVAVPHPQDQRYAALVGISYASAHRTQHPGDRGRVRRPAVRYRMRQDHAGARLQRLPGRSAPRPCADRHPDAGRARKRQRTAGVSRPGSVRGAQARARRPASAGAAGVGEAAQA
jgi:valyl-tRNA synthetase